jgi:hypothetical protein
MTRKDAEHMLTRIRAGEIQPYHTKHVRERLVSRDYMPHDILAIVQSHRHMSTPEWDEEHRGFKVELHGKCVSEGRETVLVVSLRVDGPCGFVTIMPEREFMKERAGRKK